MTVEVTNDKVTANGNGVSDTFSFSPIEVFDTDEVQVTKVATDGTETLLTEGTGPTNYEVSLNSPTALLSTGSVVYPASGSGGTKLASGESIIIKRVLALTQLTDLENQGGYFPETQEAALDRLTMIDIQQQEQIDRAVTLPISVTGTSAELPVPSADKVLGWNTAADALENKTPNTDALITLPASSTDHAVVRYDGTTAKKFLNTGVTIDDSDNVDVPGALTLGTDLAIAEGGTGASTALAARQNFLLDKHGADVASATTVDLDAATGDLVDITGTTQIDAITLAEGVEKTVRFTGALTLTHGASLVLPGSANITTAAGDFAVFRGYAGGVVRCVGYEKASGEAVVAAATAASVSSKSANYTIAQGDNGDVISVDAAATITLPEISTLTLPFEVTIKINAADGTGVTVTRSGTDDISVGGTQITSTTANSHGSYMKLVAKAGRWLVVSSEWMSFKEITLSASSTQTAAHNLGALPRKIVCTMRCNTASVGYSVGDELQFINLTSASKDSGVTAGVNSSDYFLVSAAELALVNKSTQAPTTVTHSSWTMRFKGWL